MGGINVGKPLALDYRNETAKEMKKGDREEIGEKTGYNTETIIQGFSDFGDVEAR